MVGLKVACTLAYSLNQGFFPSFMALLPSLGPDSRRIIFVPCGRFGGGFTRSRRRIGWTAALDSPSARTNP